MIVAAAFDPAVAADLIDTLGKEFYHTLLTAFQAELRTRPPLIAAQVAAGDYADARDSAHHLKGAALVIGAGRITKLACAIEQGGDGALTELSHTLCQSSDELLRQNHIAFV